MGRARDWNGVARYLKRAVDCETDEASNRGKSPIPCRKDQKKSSNLRKETQIFNDSGIEVPCPDRANVPVCGNCRAHPVLNASGFRLSRIGKIHPLATALSVTAIVAVISRYAPESYSASLVGLTFLGVTYALCVVGATSAEVRACGLSLGGLFDSEPLDFRRMLRDTLVAIRYALLVTLVIFPPFIWAFIVWWHPTHAFSFRQPQSWNDELIGQALVVALPEEAFYRGYLTHAFDQKSSRRWRLLGADVGPSLIWTSALFALGHFATEPNPTRLAVFFPALLFGWLRNRTGGVGASVVFHVLCNVFASVLGRGYGLWQ